MHMLITILAKTYNEEDATGIAQGLWEGRDAPLFGPFDYGTTMNEEAARYRDGMPDVVSESGAISLTTEDGQELLEDAWERQCKEFRRHMSVLRAGLEAYDDEEILDDPRVEDVDVEEWSPLGLGESGTAGGNIRYIMHQLGRYSGPSVHIYDETGSGVRTPSGFEWALDGDRYEFDTEANEVVVDPDAQVNENNDDLDLYVVPMDVHY